MGSFSKEVVAGEQVLAMDDRWAHYVAGGRMKNRITTFSAEPARARWVWGFVVLLGMMFLLTWAQPVTAGSGTDVNGDGKADIVWRNTSNGTTAIWLMNGTTIAASGFPGGVPLVWQIAGVGDVNGDGKADVIWRNTSSGTVAVWLMNGLTITAVGFPGSTSTDFEIVGVGDVNGDGKADLVWRNTSNGTTAIWLMNGTSIAASGFPGGLPLVWQIAGVGDVNRDGKADVIWRNTSSGTVAVWLMNGLTITAVGFPGSTSTDFEIVGVGDVNGDGKADLVWRNTSNGTTAIWLMNGTSIAASGFPGGLPLVWQIAGVGDVNGNGKADVIWRNTSSGTVAIWLMNGLTITTVGFPGSTSTDWEIQFPNPSGSSSGLSLVPANGSTVVTKTPTLRIQFGNQRSILDPTTLLITLDGINRTSLFTITPTQASAAIDLTGAQHFLKVTIKDKTGAIIEVQSLFTVSAFEVFPEVIPTSGPAPLTVQFRAKAVFTDGGINHYRWDFKGDGVFDAEDPGEMTHIDIFKTQGTFNAVLEVENDRGEKKRVTVPIQVTGIPPIPNASLDPSNGAGPLTVNFTGSARDTDGAIAKFEWDFNGDGVFDFSSTTTGNTTHTYPTQGTFPAVFRVTDNQGLTATVPVTTTTVRVGPPGTPTARIRTAPFAEKAGFFALLSGTGTDPDGTIALYEWDFEGDGTFDVSSTTIRTQSFTYNFPGIYSAVFRVTDNKGLTSTDTLDITINFSPTLIILENTCNPQQEKKVTVTSQIFNGSVPINLFIKNESGQIIRTLVNREIRKAGTYNDTWDCKNDQGAVVQKEGIHLADLQYEINGKMSSFDSHTNPGGQFIPLFSSLQGPAKFNPLANEFLNITFTLSAASEVSGSIRLSSSLDEVTRLVDRKLFGSGDHRLHWDGTDTQGRFVLPPPGDEFVVGLIRYTLPLNAIFVEGSPQLINVAATPNFFDPATSDFISPKNPTTIIAYDLSKPASVSLQVVNTLKNSLMKTITGENQVAGRNTLQWDGRNEQGMFADTGNYRLALKAIDAQGNSSIVRYAMVRVVY